MPPKTRHSPLPLSPRTHSTLISASPEGLHANPKTHPAAGRNAAQPRWGPPRVPSGQRYPPPTGRASAAGPQPPPSAAHTPGTAAEPARRGGTELIPGVGPQVPPRPSSCQPSAPLHSCLNSDLYLSLLVSVIIISLSLCTFHLSLSLSFISRGLRLSIKHKTNLLKGNN